MKAIEHLIREHRATRHVMDLAAQSFKPLDLDNLRFVLDFFKYVVDRAHHAKEEDVLFPVLLDVVEGDEADAVRSLQRDHDKSHQQIRHAFEAFDGALSGSPEAVGRLKETIESMTARARGHMTKEERVLFPMAKGWLPLEFDDRILDLMGRAQTRLVETERYDALMTRALDPAAHRELDTADVEDKPTDGSLTVDLSTADIIDTTTVIFEKDDHRVLRRTTNRPDTIRAFDALIVDEGRGLVLQPAGNEASIAEVDRALGKAELSLVVFTERDPNLSVAVQTWLKRSRAEVWVPEPWLRYEAEPSWTKPWQGRLRSIPDGGRALTLGRNEIQAIAVHGLTASVGFQLYDPIAQALLSGDLGSAIGQEASEILDFNAHQGAYALFHHRLMSRTALRIWTEWAETVSVTQIVPRRGPILSGPAVTRFIAWCRELD